jgi:hypothetical protein
MCVSQDCRHCCSSDGFGLGLVAVGLIGAAWVVSAYGAAIVDAIQRVVAIAAVIFTVGLLGYTLGTVVARYDLLNRVIAKIRAAIVRRRLRRCLSKAYELGPASLSLALPASQLVEISPAWPQEQR